MSVFTGLVHYNFGGFSVRKGVRKSMFGKGGGYGRTVDTTLLFNL